jgi:hypothetical protein
MNAFLLAPLLTFALGSPPSQNPPITTELAYPAATWDGDSSTLVIEQDRIHWKVRTRSVHYFIKARCELTPDGRLLAVVSEASSCLHPGPIEEVKKGDSFSFRFQIQDGTLTLTELKGRFFGDNEQKQILEAVYKKK